MREVADFKSGNFRGVCPILNRAKKHGMAHKDTCEFVCCDGASRRPELSETPAMPVLYCAEKKYTARCKFCPPTN